MPVAFHPGKNRRSGRDQKRLLTRAAFCFLVLSLCVARMYAHAGADEAPVTPANWRDAWSWETGIVVPLLLSAALYILGHIRILSRNHRNPAILPRQAICFWLGWLSLVLALVSPLHRLGEALFSAHMAQHEMLMVLAAPLLALSRPLVTFLFALPAHWRIRVGRWTKNKAVQTSWKLLTGAFTVWIIQAVTLWVWHIPALYQATLSNEGIHALQHIMFLMSALLFWYTLIHGRYGKLGYGLAFVYVFTTALHTSLLGVLMTFAQTVWYPIYIGRTAPWGLSPLEDQQLGGLIMWVPPGVVFLAVGIGLFAAWIGEAERRQKLSSFIEANSTSPSESAVHSTLGAPHGD